MNIFNAILDNNGFLFFSSTVATSTSGPSSSLSLSTSSPQQCMSSSNSSFPVSTLAGTPDRVTHTPVTPVTHHTPTGKITDFIRSAQDNLVSKFEYPSTTEMAAKTNSPLSQQQNIVSQNPSNETQSVSPVIDSLEDTIRYTPVTDLAPPSTTSPLCPVQEESPILFETPASVGNNEPLSVKLAKRALAKDPPPTNNSIESDPKKSFTNTFTMETDINAVMVESSPLKYELSPDRTVKMAVDVNLTPPLPPQDQTTPLNPVKSKRALSLSTKKGEAMPVKGVGPSSPLGQPRVLRGNTRLASRRGTDYGENTLLGQYQHERVCETVDAPLLGKVVCDKDKVVCVCGCCYIMWLSLLVGK